MKKNHTFFANDILVHNSVYVDASVIFKKLCNKLKINRETCSYDDIWKKDFIDRFCKLLDSSIVPNINKECERFMLAEFNSPRGDRIVFKREKLSSSGMFFAKKRYMLHARNDEGKFINKFSYTGVEVKKNEIPDALKAELSVILEEYLLKPFDYSEYFDRISSLWDKFSKMDINDIAYIKGYNTEKKVEGFLKSEKGTGVHVRAAHYYNQLLEKLKIKHKYEPINVGDKIRYVYIKKTNRYGIDCIGYKDEYPKEFNELFEINYKKMFNKILLKPLNPFEKLKYWQTPNPNQQIAYDIFLL